MNICQFCKVEIVGECYQRDSEYSTVTSCMEPECMKRADIRVEELIETEEQEEEF